MTSGQPLGDGAGFTAADVMEVLDVLDAEPGMPARFVVLDPPGREVDLHPLAFDENGSGWQQLSDAGDTWGRYEAAHLAATGSIGGRRVQCLTAELQLRFHTGYAWAAKGEHDVRLLVDNFGLAFPHSDPSH